MACYIKIFVHKKCFRVSILFLFILSKNTILANFSVFITVNVLIWVGLTRDDEEDEWKRQNAEAAVGYVRECQGVVVAGQRWRHATGLSRASGGIASSRPTAHTCFSSLQNLLLSSWRGLLVALVADVEDILYRFFMTVSRQIKHINTLNCHPNYFFLVFRFAKYLNLFILRFI